MASLHVTLSTPSSPTGGDAAFSPPSSTHKQLHPSESQLSAELALGIDPASAAGTGSSGTSSPTQALLAPKPAVIETLRGPVSPKLSPRMLGRTLNERRTDATSGGSGGGRSPAYSANSSPRGPSSHRALNSSSSDGAEGSFPGPGATSGNLSLGGINNSSAAASGGTSVERRGSGTLNGLSNLVNLNSSGQATGASASGGTLLMPSAGLVRRASKPLILSTGSNSSLQALLSKYTVADIISKRDVIEIPSTASPADGFELLLRNNVLSAPVWDVQKHEYIGFLDVRDLVSSIVFAHEEQKLQANAPASGGTGLQGNSILQKFGSSVSVPYLSRRNPFKPIPKTATLLQVARALSTQLHRLPVVDESTGKCVNIISQSSIVAFLHQHRDEVKAELSQTIGQLQIGITKVISVSSDVSAWNAFKTLEINGVSGIAIVDRDGKLVANTSARDLKFVLLSKGAVSLDEPIQQYLAKIRMSIAGDEVHPSCSIGLATNVAHAIGLLAATGYHRVFIVDSHSRPVGVVSVTDILRFCSAQTSDSVQQQTSSPNTPRSAQSLSRRTTGGAIAAEGATLGTPPASSTSPQVSPSPKGALRTTSQSTTPIVTPTPSA